MKTKLALLVSVALMTSLPLMAKNCQNVAVGDTWEVSVNNGSSQYMSFAYINDTGTKIYFTGTIGSSIRVDGYIMDTFFDYPVVKATWADTSKDQSGKFDATMSDSSCTWFNATYTTYGVNGNSSSKMSARKSSKTASTSTTATVAPPAAPALATTDCNADVISRITDSGKWFILGSLYDGCTVSGLKSGCAVAVWPFDTSVGNYSNADSISKGQGFWIRK